MQALPTKNDRLPPGLVLEKPAKNLAALATSENFRRLTSTVTAQWNRKKEFAALAKYGLQPINRLLFYGPPGNGKTMASQWLAAQLDVPLYRLTPEVFVGRIMGDTERGLAEVLDWLAKQPACVVLFDEAEQLLVDRKQTTGPLGRELTSAMAMFWQRLDRWEAATLFILATNLDDRLDAALLSRIDLKLFFGPPTPEQAEAVIGYWQEVLHEYGSDQWGPVLQTLEGWESFRELFYTIQQYVREHVASGPTPNN
jgi:ATP-dependent 26S proteasome regulatory subunit